MVNGALFCRSGPVYFRFQSGDAGVQFGHGQGAQILSEQPGQWIVSPAG
jgi:hypothetical protein